MIRTLDNLLRDLVRFRVPGIGSEGQVGFQPPDQEWRNVIVNLGVNALNIYLVDIRENRKLRSNERTREVHDGVVSESAAPRHLDCHYLITAWSPARVTSAIEPTLDEHELLYEVAAALMCHEVLIPEKVYAPNPVPPGFEDIATLELPVTILPVEGFPKYAEFWGTMGHQQGWKPAIYLIVTIPVLMPRRELGGVVTTRITEYGRGGAGPSETWVQIGGVVRDGAGAAVSGAWVRLQRDTGEALQTATTDEEGRFTFGGLVPGSYRVRARAAGLGECDRPLEVPSLSGDYDLSFR